MSMNCKIYVSDEGLGPLVRQSAIVEEFRKIGKSIHFTVQTERHSKDALRLIGDITTVNRFNNVIWSKNEDGSPCVPKIKLFFSDYLQRTDDFITEELRDFEYDFVLSDFVYEAFHVAAKRNVPSFGISHFTWDWFFSKMFPPPLTDRVLDRFFECANAADVLYFPPFTPHEILSHYRSKAREVPLIVRDLRQNDTVQKDPRFKVLIMDSGSSVIAPQIRKALEQVSALKDICFYISSRFACEAENIVFIDPRELFSDYMPHMDLVITRAGFNTISECIAHRTPLLLVGEAVNPEMNENMLMIKKAGLGSFVAMDTFMNELETFLPRFVEHEYRHIQHRMATHEIPSNGASVVVEDILNRIEGL